MKRQLSLLVCLVVLILAPPAAQAGPITINVGGMTVGSGDHGILSAPFDLTSSADGFVIKATLDLNGVLASPYHTIFKLGVHDTGTADNQLLAGDHGVWLATDHEWGNADGFAPDASTPSRTSTTRSSCNGTA